MSSQGEMHDDDMVGLTVLSSEDNKLEESTMAPREFPQHNAICGYCTQQGQAPTYIKFANHKVFRAGKPMCLACYNRIESKNLTLKQFMKKSADEYHQVMLKLDPGAVLLTERAAKNPKRTQEEVHEGLAKVSKTQEETLKASTDYLAYMADGFEGWYVCRNEGSLADAKILRVQERGTGKWRNPTEEEVDALADLNCSMVIVPINQWFRGGVGDKYRCPINFCPYYPFSQKKGCGCAFYIVFHDDKGQRFYVPAEPPQGDECNHVSLLKVMFCEEYLPALLGNAQGVDHYWAIINEICGKEFAVLMKDCGGVEIEIKKPPFQIKESRASLNVLAVGRGLKCAILPRERLLVDKWWGQAEWKAFIHGMFAYFNVKALSDAQFNSFSKADRRFMLTVGHLTAGSNPLHPPPPPHHPPHHPPHLAFPPPPPLPPPHPPPLPPPSPPPPPLLPPPPTGCEETRTTASGPEIIQLLTAGIEKLALKDGSVGDRAASANKIPNASASSRDLPEQDIDLAESQGVWDDEPEQIDLEEFLKPLSGK